jgi:hypothetical protein
MDIEGKRQRLSKSCLKSTHLLFILKHNASYMIVSFICLNNNEKLKVIKLKRKLKIIICIVTSLSHVYLTHSREKERMKSI